jgi:phosphoglycerate dehydrogenase-like enzyme
VAEHTIMGALSCLKKLTLQQEKMREGIWAQDEMAEHGVFELFGKTLGIVGLGRIGKQVAARVKPFGCNTIYYDIVRPDEGLEAELGVSFRELDELVAESDILCLHVPLTPETRHMIDAARVAGMKQGAILVNVARGEVIDEDAVAAALKEGRLAGAVIDVFSEEPVPADNPLLDCPNTVLTPHTAGATNESRLRIINVAMGNIVKVLKGEPPENVVNGVAPGRGS